MMQNKRSRFLFFLWAVIASSFLLFQNNTLDVDGSGSHNDLCQMAFKSNESRIGQLANSQGRLLAEWPNEAGPIGDMLLDIKEDLYATNLSLLDSCSTKIDQVEPDPVNLLALAEITGLTDSEKNSSWKHYLGMVEQSLSTVSEGASR